MFTRDDFSINPFLLVYAFISISVAGIVTATAQVGNPSQVCLKTVFVELACDGLVHMSDPECGPDEILFSDPVLDVARIGEHGEGCGHRKSISEWVQCQRRFFEYDEVTESCESGGIFVQQKFSREVDPNSEPCGSC